MALQLFLGALLASMSIAIQAGFIGVAARLLTCVGRWFVGSHPIAKLILALIAVALWLLAAISAAIWIWAIAYLGLGVFDALEPALYFSVVAFTTLGFGDITLTSEWRLLSGVMAANGLIAFGVNIAFLNEAMTRIRAAQEHR